MTDLPQLRPHALRGKAYFDQLKGILSEIGPAILADVAGVREDTGSITVSDVCEVALRHKLNLKATFDFLEDSRILPCGTYDRCKEGGIKPMAALREVWAEMQGECVEKPSSLPSLTDAERAALDKLRGDGWAVEYSPRMCRWTLKKGAWTTSPHVSMGEAVTAAETLQSSAALVLAEQERKRTALRKYLESGR